MKLIMLAIALPLFAADPEGFAMWKSTELTERGKPYKADATGMAGGGLGSVGGYSAILVRRDKTGEAESHENFADVMMVVDGEAMLVIGGTVADTRQNSPGEVRGKSIAGGVEKKIGPGDIIHLPGKMPHWVTLQPGKQITYFLLKLDKK